jgi:anti-sigma factor RsiW
MFKRVNSDDLSHDRVESRLSEYIDGRLPQEERLQISRHLQACPSCQESLESLQWTVKLLKQVPAPRLPRQFTLPVPEPRRTTSPWLKWGLATASSLAAAVFVLIVAVDVLSQRSAPSELALPAAAPSDKTLVAAALPTSVPSRQQFSSAPTSAPQLEAATTVPSSAPVATITPASTSVPNATKRVPQVESIAPTQVKPPPVAKSAPVSPSCEACGGGVGGAPAETPRTNSAMVAPPIAAVGIVKDASLVVHDSPSDDGTRIGALVQGTQIQVLKRDASGGWLDMVFPIGNDQGLSGWVAAKSVTLHVFLDTLPIEPLATETPTTEPETNVASPRPGYSTETATPELIGPETAPVAGETLTPTETSPPTPIASPTSVAPSMLDSSQPPTSTASLETPPSSLPFAPAMPSHSPAPAQLRFGEIGSLFGALVFGAAAYIVSRNAAR